MLFTTDELKALASEWSNQKQENSIQISTSTITYIEMIGILYLGTVPNEMPAKINVRYLTTCMLQNVSKIQGILL